jgi:hypothetical protein
VDCSLVALISIPLDQLDVRVLLWELDKIKNLAEICEGYKAALLAENVKDAHEVQALIPDMGVNLAEKILVVMKVEKRLSVKLDLFGCLRLAYVLQEDLDELHVVNRAIS